MIFAYPSQEHAYRHGTALQAKHPGVTGYSFWCVGCNTSRRTAGRKQTALGYRCAECMAKRAARRAARLAAKRAA